jgi:hypothetical protein
VVWRAAAERLELDGEMAEAGQKAAWPIRAAVARLR